MNDTHFLCPNCKQPTSSEAKYCSLCRFDLSSTATSDIKTENIYQPITISKPEKHKSNNNLLTILLLATIIILIAISSVSIYVPIVVLLAFVTYFLPSIVAKKRLHNKLNTIVVINFFLGWTFIGWVIALAWAVSADTN